jgi:hypothetical protein
MNYLALLRQTRERAAPTAGALAERTLFARVYNHLLPQQRKFTFAVSGASRRYFYDGAELSRSALVGLRLYCAQNGVVVSLEAVRQAAIALAAANPATDPWEDAIGAFIDDAIASADLSGNGPVARIAIRGELHCAVAFRDIKLQLGARGAGATERIRVVMKTLGWQERHAYLWGRRMRCFARIAA